jgi:hypothetical protein
MRKTVIVNWNDLSSIKKGEAKKLQLENKGYRLIDTQSSMDYVILVYELKE